ncbi:MAG: ATP-dependent DNA helicase [Patescibacteria group bacterium]|jgi:DNA helicase-2/ATP-dependent DNA helicase PcrA
MSNLLQGLNDEQRRAVIHGEGPLMIIAGAGTGKTTVITKRIAWLIAEGKATPNQILALTFTEKAANEMEERVDVLLPMGYVDLSISTFHAFCERMLREHGVDIGLPQDFVVVSEVDAWLLMRRHLSDFALDYYRPRGNPTKFFRLLLSHFSRAKDETISPQHYIDHVERLINDAEKRDPVAFAAMPEEERLEFAKHREIAFAYKKYQEILLAEDALDFGDLLAYSVELLKTRPNILAKYREQYKYIVVDEFQDTNSVQYELVRLLAAPKNNLTIVGDDDQAIYKFRGAALANILRFREDYPNTAKIVLVQNYRSGKVILDYAYTSIAGNNPHRLEITEGLSKQLQSNTEYLGEVCHIHAATLEDEVENTIEIITKLHNENEVAWSDFAILVRGNDHADPFLEALEYAGIPFRFMALSGLYSKPIILDVLAYLRVINTPHDSPSLYRVLSHPRLGLSQSDLASLMFYAKRKGMSLFDLLTYADAAGISMEGRNSILDIVSTIGKLRDRAKRLPIVELFVAIVKESGILGDCQMFSEEEQQELYRQLQKFLARLKRFSVTNDDVTLSKFLEEFDAERAAGEGGAIAQDPESGPDVVSVMTVHGSKGLEFRYVFVVNLVEQRFPSVSRSSAFDFPLGLLEKNEALDDHIAEERRLFYVAITRAKEGLYLMSADDYGGARKKKISRFLAELGFTSAVVASGYERIASRLSGDSKPDRKGDAQIHIPDKISFSQIAAFSSCPQQYKYAHIIGVPSYGKHQMSFGKSMHNTLQRYMERIIANKIAMQASLFDSELHQITKPSLHEFMEMYDAAWIDEWYPDSATRDDYKERGQKYLKEYFAIMALNPPSPKFLEKGFTLKVGDVLVKGRIDRIDDVEGGVEIVDYKTGTPKVKLEWDDRRQLVLYAIAAEESFTPPLVVKKLSFYYVESNTAVSFEPTDKDREKLKMQIHATMEQIRTSLFEATPGPHCQYCDFKDICPYAKA